MVQSKSYWWTITWALKSEEPQFKTKINYLIFFVPKNHHVKLSTSRGATRIKKKLDVKRLKRCDTEKCSK